MRFRDQSRLDPSQVEDVRGRSGVPGGKVTIGGGGLGIVGVIITLVLVLSGGGGGLSSALTQLDDQSLSGTGSAPSELRSECRTGADANAKDDCRILGYVNSIQAYWRDSLGSRYTPATTVFFDGQVGTGCGTASAEVGPFYCPSDGRVYIDLGFYDELRSKFGATAGPAAGGGAGDRRRPRAERVPGQGDTRVVDARVLRAAPALVQHRVPVRGRQAV